MVQVPQRDADGNPVGGVRLPDMEVLLGVHGVQNEHLSFTCSLVSAFLPFSRTSDSAEGKRPSLAERYRNRADYVNKIRVAARAAQAAGFLLPEMRR